jgi:hypothetical protein
MLLMLPRLNKIPGRSRPALIKPRYVRLRVWSMAATVTLDGEAWEGPAEDAGGLHDEWLVKQGDTVPGLVLANVALIKASHEWVFPVDGTLNKPMFAGEDNLRRGAPLFEIS